MALRLARPQDGGQLLEIYRQYISTNITFEYQLPLLPEFERRIAHILEDGYPYLVWEEGGTVLGYAYAHRVWERAAYQWTAELSVYLHPRSRGQGLGRRLYLALMELLRLQGIRTVYGVVTQDNQASIDFHQALGFHRTAVFSRAGYKNGQWLDVHWFERELAPSADAPAPILPLERLPRARVEEILASFSHAPGTEKG